jgi:methylamine dehydrogenase accessory protein MauD
MTELLLTGMIVQWLVIIGLVVAVLALGRQVGLLHTRLAPAGALVTASGPKVGEFAPRLSLATLTGDTLEVGGPRSRALLILFVSPTCPLCKALVPAARALARSERQRLDLAFASDGGDATSHGRYVADMEIEPWPYVQSFELGMRFEVAKLPYAVLIDAAGVLRSKGLVNSREHLESLLESMDSGFATLQDYLNAEPSEELARDAASRSASSTSQSRS